MSNIPWDEYTDLIEAVDNTVDNIGTNIDQVVNDEQKADHSIEAVQQLTNNLLKRGPSSPAANLDDRTRYVHRLNNRMINIPIPEIREVMASGFNAMLDLMSDYFTPAVPPKPKAEIGTFVSDELLLGQRHCLETNSFFVRDNARWTLQRRHPNRPNTSLDIWIFTDQDFEAHWLENHPNAPRSQFNPNPLPPLSMRSDSYPPRGSNYRRGTNRGRGRGRGNAHPNA